MNRSAPRYSPPADRVRRAARDPFLVRLAVLAAAGLIVTPIAILLGRSSGSEVVKTQNLPGAAVAVEPALATTGHLELREARTIPALAPAEGTLPATIPPPTTAAPTTADAAGALAAAAPAAPELAGAKPTAAPKPTSAPKPPPTTAAPPPPEPPRVWGESEVVQLIRDVFPDDIEEKALAIAYRESHFDPNAQNFCCTGLFQIYGSVHVKLINSLGFTVDQLTDPLVNCVVANALYPRARRGPGGG